MVAAAHCVLYPQTNMLSCTHALLTFPALLDFVAIFFLNLRSLINNVYITYPRNSVLAFNLFTIVYRVFPSLLILIFLSF